MAKALLQVLPQHEAEDPAGLALAGRQRLAGDWYRQGEHGEGDPGEESWRDAWC